MRMRHNIIPVPEEVLERQEILRSIRTKTAILYGIPNRPFEMGTSEYEYMKEEFLKEFA